MTGGSPPRKQAADPGADGAGVVQEPLAFDTESISRAGDHLEDFASTLTPAGRAALDVLLSAGGRPRFPAVAALGELPAEAVLSPAEFALYQRLAAEVPARAGALRSMIVMIMKATRLCNLRCSYCNQWRDGPNQVMGFPVLIRAVRDVLRAPGVGNVQFVWHGGEATLLPISFYHKALWLQQQFQRPGQVVSNAIQTNGVRLSDEWLGFLRRYRFSVGVSLDGPPEVHDQRRIDVRGKPTSARVRLGLKRLRDAGISHGVLLVVDNSVVDVGPQRLLEYLMDIDVAKVDFLNALPSNTPVGAPGQGFYLSFPRYVEFLCEVFRCWWPQYAERIWIRELGGLVRQLAGGKPESCVFAGDCFGGFLTIEPSGDVSACDKYVGDQDYHFGNLLSESLSMVLSSGRLTQVRADNAEAVAITKECRWFSVCQGGCPHDRYTSIRRLPEGDSRCCGFAPLLAEMAAVLARDEGQQPAKKLLGHSKGPVIAARGGSSGS